jgi:hypothetical protein
MDGTDTLTARGTGVYIYGVIPTTDADDWPGAAGIGGPAARAVPLEGTDLAALVSPLPPDHTPGRREDFEAHRHVLSVATERGTVVPMRFGMVMGGDDVVRDRLLRRHASELADLLRSLRGKVQMNVRAFYAENALLGAVMASDPEIAQRSAAIQGRSEMESRDERIALGQMIAAAVDQRRALDEETLLERLTPLAADVKVDAPGSDRVALNAQLLVDRERRPALDEVVRILRNALDGYLAIRYIGPLAPYSFSSLSLESEDTDT